MAHTIEVTLDDTLTLERDPAELRESIRQGLILLDYTSARISIGRFAELMEMSCQQAGRWLHSRGVATLRKLSDPSLETACDANYQDLAEALGLSSDEGRVSGS